jgi:hypothetical protein
MRPAQNREMQDREMQDEVTPVIKRCREIQATGASGGYFVLHLPETPPWNLCVNLCQIYVSDGTGTFRNLFPQSTGPV